MRITPRGAGLLAAGVVALAAGFGLGYPELGVLGTAALVAVGFAVAYAAWRPALTVQRSAEPDRVARGEACTVTLVVGNSSRLRAASLVAQDRCGRQAVAVPLLRLRPGRDTAVSYPVPTSRRGVVPIGPLSVTRRDPLGLVAVDLGYGDAVRVWVYPRILPLRAVPAGVARSLDGRVDRVPHGSITFDALRGYVIGDELRHVHWRTSARVGELMVREHVDTSLPRIVVLLDDRAAAYDDAAVAGGAWESPAFESACEAAASVVAAAVRAELAVALRLVSGAAVESGGRQAETARPLLDALAEAGLARPAQDALDSTLAALRLRPAGDTLVFLTGAGGRRTLGGVASLGGGYPALLAVVFDPAGRGEAGRRTGGLLVIDARDVVDFAAAWEGARV